MIYALAGYIDEIFLYLLTTAKSARKAGGYNGIVDEGE